MRDQVFISYSHKDQKWLQKLHTHLKPFERTHKIQVWDDTTIVAGTKWRDEIETALKEAKVAVLLVSPNYLASDFIAYQELPPMLAAAETEGLKVIWVAVSASAYLETNIKEYQAANDPTRPLDCLKPAKLNEALVKICEAIRTAVDDMPADCAEPINVSRTPVRRSRARTAKPEQQDEMTQAVSPLQVAPTSQPAPTLQATTRTPSSTEETRRTSRFNSKLLFIVGGVILALVIGGIFVYSRFKDGATPQPKPAAPLLADWQIASLFQAHTGQPFTLNLPFDANLDGNLSDRPANTNGLTFIEGGGRERVRLATGRQFSDYINRTTLQVPGGTRYVFLNGATGRNTVRGDRFINLDLAFSKRFRFTEEQVLIFRTEIFNLFNRANFGLPIGTIGAPGFGSSVDTISPARMIQFALKYGF